MRELTPCSTRIQLLQMRRIVANASEREVLFIETWRAGAGSSVVCA